jgi:predicted DNA-binding transcriptional regulator YafY
VAKETDTEVVVEVDPEAYRLIGESANFEAMIADGNNPGTVRATIRVGYLPNIGHLIARYGGAARVISPEEAKQYVRDYALAALEATPEASNIEAE